VGICQAFVSFFEKMLQMSTLGWNICADRHAGALNSKNVRPSKKNKVPFDDGN